MQTTDNGPVLGTATILSVVSALTVWFATVGLIAVI